MEISRRGSLVLEAALVMPLVIMVMITVIIIIGFFYMHTAEQSEMHIALRASSGSMNGHTLYNNRILWHGTIDQKETALGGTVYGRGYFIMSKRTLLERELKNYTDGRYYATDGPKYVRYCSIVEEYLDDEE